MSRSTYVYVAQTHGLVVIGTWTVKHELASWIEQGDRRARVTLLTRHRDGQPWAERVEMDKHTLEVKR